MNNLLKKYILLSALIISVLPLRAQQISQQPFTCDSLLFKLRNSITAFTPTTESINRPKQKTRSQLPSDSLINTDSLRIFVKSKACEYLGVPYRYGQCSEKGFDCSGYVKYIYDTFGFELPHSSSGQYRICRRIAAEDAMVGDLVFFITRGEGISHVGIYLGNNSFIHSPGRNSVVSISTLDDGYYKRHLAGFGTLF